VFICDNCNRTFENPVVNSEDPSPPGVGLPDGEYKWAECPYCESELVYEAWHCGVDGCGEWSVNGDFMCKQCVKELWTELDRLRRKFSGTAANARKVDAEFFNNIDEWEEDRW